MLPINSPIAAAAPQPLTPYDPSMATQAGPPPGAIPSMPLASPMGGDPSVQPPGGAEDAMGTPEGAIVGTPMNVQTNYLATMVQANFSTAKMSKLEQEGIWTKCHTNYRGNATPAKAEAAMGLRSKVTMKITRTKVAAAVARHKDIGFKYDIKPTPEPNVIDFSPSQLRSALQDILASMQNKDLASEIQAEMNVDQLMQQVKDLAKARSEAMKIRIADDLVEMRWDASYDHGLLDWAIYGTMIYRGPLTKERRPGRWIRKGGAWGFMDVNPDVKLYRPEAENISPWDFYPSPGGWTVEKLDYAIVRNVMGHREVTDLVDNPGFDQKEIFAALADKTGAWVAEPWELQMYASNNQANAVGMGMPDKYVVLEWWGYIKVEDLKRWGGTVEKVPYFDVRTLSWQKRAPDDKEVVIANVWVCGNHVLRAWHTPLKPRRLPFYVVPYERIPKNLWGQGVAWMMEDWQAVINTVYRAMMDNMAASALPFGWFDRERLRKDDKGDFFPGKMYEMKDTERLTIPPVQFSFTPNNVAHMRMIAEIARANIQESTSLPDIIQGQMGPGGHRTAEGLSMLGGWADTSTRSVQKNADQELTKPFIRSLYFWEMQFSNDDSIKGDFDVEALGVESVMADEILTQRMNQWAQVMQQNPDTAKRVNWERFGKASARVMGLKDEALMYSDAEVEKRDQAAMQAQAQMDAAKQNATQPEMSAKDQALKVLERVPEGSPIQGPVLRMVLQKLGMLTEEINTAINISNQTNVNAAAGQMTPADQALLERANASQDAGGPATPGDGGTGGTSGLPTPGGPVPGIPG